VNLYIALLSKIPLFGLLLLSASCVVAGDFFVKYWSLHQKPLYLLLTFFFYMGSAFFYAPTLLKAGLVTTSIIWSLLGIIGFLVIGLLVFGETLTTLQIVGVVLGGISMIILSL
jgi:multidrug transporter EmrE-like cation transporter